FLSLDELARDPTRAADLDPSERAQVQLRCAVILAALAQIPVVRHDDGLLAPAEVATRLRVSRSTVYEMMGDGRLPYVETGERGKLIPESELREFIQRSTRKTSQPTLDAIRARVRSKVRWKDGEHS